MLAQLRVDRDQLLIPESWVSVESVLRGAEKQGGHDKKYAACRDLCRDQHLADNGFVLPLARNLQCGSETEERGSEHSCDAGECQYAPVGCGGQPSRRVGSVEHQSDH